jgi:hypothetical protein
VSTEKHQGWQRGPLPPDTWGHGGVVPVGEILNDGFYFADFNGNHVVCYPKDDSEFEIPADRVAWFNNCLTLPPASEG